MHAFENVLSLIVGTVGFGERKQWEADFLRHLLGFTTFDDESLFSTRSLRMNTSFAAMVVLLLRLLAKKLHHSFRHDSPLKNDMYANEVVEMRLLFDCLGNNVRPWHLFNPGRLVASFLNGNNKQRFFIDVVLREKSVLDDNPLPWIVYIGCNQGQSTGEVQPALSSHKLSAVKMYSLGWIFHVTDFRYENSLKYQGLKRYTRDSLHFMDENDGGVGNIRKGAGTKAPRHYETTIYRVLHVPMLIRDGYDLFLTQIGVLLLYDDLPEKYFRSVPVAQFVFQCLQPNRWTYPINLEFRKMKSPPCKGMRNICHQARYPSTLTKIINLLNGEFPGNMYQREDTLLGSSWARRYLKTI